MIVLLGTNAYTAIMRGDDLLLAALQHAQAVLMSSTVVGEPEYGYRYAANRQLMNIFRRRLARQGWRVLGRAHSRKLRPVATRQLSN
jgi:predicted nucleic acid-binding protein